ncbi:zinc finger protein 628-like isoform X2 [Patiria miniata]|uniref:C2H2-type domain-containing protein n=1 Tax=Patiria miniata TaxID=46514 RepID=A0A913ZGU1_PATMI|nr:zinc finger protein 628-like isoform X2 [Patiria miniata]
MEEESVKKTQGMEEAEMTKPTNKRRKRGSVQDEARKETKGDDVTNSDTGDNPPAKKKKVWPAKYNKGPFICAYCSKKFRGLLDLTRHERTHTNEKPLLCPECGMGFAGDSSLRVHLMIHRDDRPFACPTCKAAFRSKPALREHMVVHTDLRPHVCKICGTGLRQRSSLKKHMRIHTGERPHKCEICDRAFSKLETCRLHQQRHADPNSRVNRIPKEPRRNRNRVRGGRKFLPQRVRWEITRDLCRQVDNSQTPAAPLTNLPTNMVSVTTPLNISPLTEGTSMTSASTGSTVPTGDTRNGSLTPSVVQAAAKSTNGTNVALNGPTLSNVPTAPIQGTQVYVAPPFTTHATSSLPGSIITSDNVTPVDFHKTGGRMPIQTLTSDSPVLVNARQVVTFQFTPFMVIKTPFGDLGSNTASSETAS